MDKFKDIDEKHNDFLDALKNDGYFNCSINDGKIEIECSGASDTTLVLIAVLLKHISKDCFKSLDNSNLDEITNELPYFKEMSNLASICGINMKSEIKETFALKYLLDRIRSFYLFYSLDTKNNKFFFECSSKEEADVVKQLLKIQKEDKNKFNNIKEK